MRFRRNSHFNKTYPVLVIVLIFITIFFNVKEIMVVSYFLGWLIAIV